MNTTPGDHKIFIEKMLLNYGGLGQAARCERSFAGFSPEQMNTPLYPNTPNDTRPKQKTPQQVLDGWRAEEAKVYGALEWLRSIHIEP